MIKSDIADLLSTRWNKPLSEIKEYIKVSSKGDEEKVALASGLDDCFNDFREMFKEGGTNLGFKSIDESLDGIRKQEVIVLSAFSNHGKSFVAAKIAAYRILYEHNNVLIFSMEMPKGQFLQFIIQEVLHLSLTSLKLYMNTDEGLEVYNRLKEKLGKHLRIVDQPGKTMKDVWEITSALATDDFKADFVIFDHFHIIPGIADIPTFEDNSRLMKEYVKEFNNNLLMLAQFNDASQQRGAKKARPPINTDIKGPINIVSDADIILLLYRPYLMEDNMDAISKEELKFATMIKIGKSRRELQGGRLFRYDYQPNDSSFKEMDIR